MDKISYYLHNAVLAEKDNDYDLAKLFRSMAEDVIDTDDIVVEVDASDFEIDVSKLIDNIIIK